LRRKSALAANLKPAASTSARTVDSSTRCSVCEALEPAPAGALLGLLPVFLMLGGFADPTRAPWAVAVWLGIIGLLMVSRLRTLSPKAVRIPRERSRFILVAAALLVGLMLTRFWLLLVIFDAAYVALLVHAAVSARRQRRR